MTVSAWLAPEVAHYRALLRDVFTPRRWVVVSRSPQRAARTARQLTALGAAAPFLVVGEPAEPAAGMWCADITTPDDLAFERAFDDVLTAPPPDLRAALDRFDAASEAFVLDSRDFAGPTLLGRARYGWRRPEWARFEDKVFIGAIWAAAGIHRVPEQVVPASADRLRKAASALDRGSGTVWAGDASAGVNWGGSCTWWVRTGADAEAAAAFMASRCATVRVMPFVEGIPCSVHGLVVGGEVVVLRPLEVVIYRHPDGHFRYGGVSTYWDPTAEEAALVRDAARSVGRALAGHGYRGGFTLDAVLGPGELVPTEVNARLGTGLNLDEGLPGLDIDLLNRLLREDEPGDYRPHLLERLALDALDRVRAGYTNLPADAVAPTSYDLTATADGGYEVSRGGAVDAVLAVEPHRRGMQASFTPVSAHLAGDLLAPRSLVAFAAVRPLGIRVPPVSVAPG